MTELVERVERLERREAEMTEILSLLHELHDADKERTNALSQALDVTTNMILEHLGLPRLPETHEHPSHAS